MVIFSEEMPPCDAGSNLQAQLYASMWHTPIYKAEKDRERISGSLTSFQTHSPAALSVVAVRILFVSNGFPYEDEIEQLLVLISVLPGRSIFNFLDNFIFYNSNTYFFKVMM